MDTRATLDATPAAAVASPGFGLMLAWVVFWALQLTVELQDAWRHGDPTLWRPMLWVGSSFVVASLIAWMQWRRAGRLDHRIAQPWYWFLVTLRTLPLLAAAFVACVYALRHGVFALLGRHYVHEPWSAVFGYEMLKFGMFYLLFVAMVFGIRSHAALTQARVGLEQERRLAQQAQLLQLTQQIEPHFLFNALNTIASTLHSDPDLADRLLTRLAALLRAATDLARQPETTLDEELRLLEAYAAIMCQRFADRVTLQFHIDPAARSCRVPTLLLQPLLENAFRHGVERRPGACRIDISAAQHGDELWLTVADDAGSLPAAPQQPARGVGLGNLHQRLQARYGDAAALTLDKREGGGVQARIVPAVAGWRRGAQRGCAGMSAPLRLLIVDDEPPARERLLRLLGAFADVQVVGQARDGEEALAQVAALAPDALLLDVQMPGPSGLDVAASLPEPAPAVILVTAFDRYALQAFDAAALDYLLKPVEPERLARAIQRLRDRQALAADKRPAPPHPPPAQLLIADRGRVHVLPVAEIQWLEAADNYVIVHGDKRAPLMRRTLAGLLADLGPGFVRTHRGAAVALAQVTQWQARANGDGLLLLRGGASVPCSRRQRAAVLAGLGLSDQPGS